MNEEVQYVRIHVQMQMEAGICFPFSCPCSRSIPLLKLLYPLKLIPHGVSINPAQILLVETATPMLTQSKSDEC